MQSKVFSFLNITDGSVIPSVRIARMVADELGLPLVDSRTMNDDAVDVLFIVNGAYAFCSCLETLGTAIERAQRVVWIQNDYTIIPPKKVGSAESPFRKAFRNRFDQGKPDTDFWSTCEDFAKLTSGSCLINWNCLTVDTAKPATIKKRRAEANAQLLYYGSFRADRKKHFDRYFTDPRVEVVISSPSRKFRDSYVNARVMHADKITIDFFDYIGHFGMGLYLEDRRSHREFHSPPNRFYEMLSAGLPILFQPECGTMLRRAGYDPSPYQAGAPLEVERMMKKREDIGEAQRAAWLKKVLDEREKLPLALREAAKKLEL
jgi:hypothetical protein